MMMMMMMTLRKKKKPRITKNKKQNNKTKQSKWLKHWKSIVGQDITVYDQWRGVTKAVNVMTVVPKVRGGRKFDRSLEKQTGRENPEREREKEIKKLIERERERERERESRIIYIHIYIYIYRKEWREIYLLLLN